MRVAFDGRSLTAPALRGWDRYTVGLVRELAARGVEVVLLHRAGEPVREEHVRGLGCRTQAVEARRGLAWEQVAVPLALLRGGFDVYHAPAERGVPLVAPCPTVLTVHSVTLHSYASFIRRGLLPGTVRTTRAWTSSGARSPRATGRRSAGGRGTWRRPPSSPGTRWWSSSGCRRSG